jgi:hypothetical protein
MRGDQRGCTLAVEHGLAASDAMVHVAPFSAAEKLHEQMMYAA